MADPSSLFREEALKHWAGHHQEGEILRLSPVWTRWAYWVLVAAIVVGGAFALLGRVGEYARGPAVVRVEGRVELTATAEGTVASVDVQPGQRVTAGQVLVRFHGAPEQGELERTSREFELQLVKALRDPADETTRQALTTLRAARDLAERRLAQRTVRAPRAGAVNDVRIRPGQHLQPGDTILSLVGDDQAQFAVVAVLPGGYRPLLHPGMRLRMELSGFPHRYWDVTIDSVGDEIVGPSEVRRFLGPEIGDAVPIGGPVVLVRAHLPSRTFRHGGRELNYYDGMPGKAAARVRSDSVLVTLVPGLKALFPDGG